MAQDETDWRSRYRQILGEKVELEEQLQAEITSLRRSLGKIGVATEGLVADIDADLRRLRQAIADEKSSVELQALIESIAATMVQVDERRGQQGLERGRFLAALTGQLERLKLDLPATIRSALRKTAKAVEQHPQQDPAAFERLVPQLMAIIEYQNTGKLASPSDNPSLLTRLFGSKTEVVEVAVAEAVPLDLSLLIEPMQRLMASLTQDSPQQTQLSKLSQRLAQVGSLEELADLLQQLSELLVELNSQEQLQFEQFLQQLTSRLDLIQGFLADSGQSFEQGNQLDQQVRSQVQGLQKSVREATTLPALQQAVQQRLDTILANLDQFQEKQRDLQRSSELKIARLKTQLQETEKESSLLRDNLVKQRLQAMTDSLTQLPNRFAYQVRLRHEYLRWHRHGAPAEFGDHGH
jgi:diguanylate cyclase